MEEPRVSGEELYRRYMGGDVSAFEELVSLYEDEFSLFLNHIVYDYQEAKHLMIEAFAHLAVNNRQFAEKSSIKTYLFAIGKNLAYRHIKMQKDEQHIPFEDVVDTLIDDGETLDHFLERDENRRLLHEAMQGLKENYRRVLILLYFEDMSYTQAGRAMKKSDTQIRGLAYRAKLALKKKLENIGITND